MLNIDDNILRYCTLSIRLAPNGFSFFVFNERSQEVIAFKDFPIDYHKDVIAITLAELRKEVLFSYPFNEVRILMDFPEATSVPNIMYDEEHKEQLYAKNVNITKNEFVIDNSVSIYDLKVLFSVPQKLYHFFNDNFTKIKFVHKLTNVLELAHKYKEKVREQMFVSYNNDHIVAVGLRNNMLVYHNCFNIMSDEDLIYYFLLVFQELGFDQYEAKVLVDGPISADHKAINVIREYISNIDFASLPDGVIVSQEIAQLPQHFYSNLLSLPFCE